MRRTSWIAGVVTLAGLAGSMTSSGQEPEPPYEKVPISTERAPYDPTIARKTAEFWAAKSGRDPQGALAFRELAGAYLALQRETGDIADAVRAEEAARKSLAILGRGNTVAAIRLARALLTQHRFPEALEIAKKAAAADPTHSGLVADIELELGNYDAATEALSRAPAESTDMNGLALRARFAEIAGRPDQSLELMEQAGRLADQRPDMPAEAVAWYHTMIGHALIDSGQLDKGEKSCLKALAIFPNDYRAMTGMAEAANHRGDHRGVVEWGGKAIAASNQNPEALRLVGDAYATLGRPREADEHYRLLDVLAHSFPRIYDRHWIMFCLDNGRDLEGALALARKDLELRHDIHAYETLAWACYKNGRLPEAVALMDKALSRGTQEAPLFHHAAVIASAAGNKVQAANYLERVRALNPYLAKPEIPAKPATR